MPIRGLAPDPELPAHETCPQSRLRRGVGCSRSPAAAPAQSTFGMAGVPCSQYTKAARSSDILYHQASQWLLGYVSGMNAAMKVAKGTTPLANLTNDQVLKSAGDYCEANPASNLANAANEWYATLPKQTDPQAAQKDPQRQQPDAQPRPRAEDQAAAGPALDSAAGQRGNPIQKML